MGETDLIGVVTVTYNSASVLKDFLRSLTAQTHRNFLLFVVDNSSSDETLRILGDCKDERLRIIANSQNVGVAAGNNQGIRAALEAGCSSVLLINNDTEFGTGLVSELDEALDEYQAEMTCPKILYFDDSSRIWAAGGRFLPWLGYRSAHYGEGELDRGQFDTPRAVTYVPTCCVLIRASVFERVGLMDERYFVYVDDVDFMYRAMKMKQKLVYVPQSKLLHKVGRLTGGSESPFTARYGTRNRVYFMLQHLGALSSIPMLAMYQLYYAAGLLVRKFSPDTYVIKQKAVYEGIRMWSDSRRAKTGLCRR
jgi:hypothetical protein